MDLQRCPKCGKDWSNGAQKCYGCGFVPIGVGLDKVKKKKKRVGKYVEPGSFRGVMTYGMLIGIVVFAGVKRPWEDDWEFVRALFGQGRHHSVVGEWEIVKTVAINKSKAVLANQKVNKGTLNFTDKGQLKFNLQSGKASTDATGSYKVAGTLVAINQISCGEGGGVMMPNNMNMRLAWTGPDTVVASCNESEALYLRRHNKGNALVNLIHVGIKPGSGDAPEGIKALGDKMTAGTRDAEKDSE